jgi:hypothetical protein
MKRASRLASGWHRARGLQRATDKNGLTCFWIHDNGTQIFQGRPDLTQRFVYRLCRPDGTSSDFSFLADAKAAGTAATTLPLPL